MTEGIERFVPEEGKASLMAAEHVARYRFAAQLVRGRTVLDAACGSGYGSAILASAGAKSVTGIDIALDALPSSRHGVTFTTADLRDLPFAEASFDCVVCFEAIEHVAEPEQVIDELARVLSGDGVLVLSTPNRMVNPPGNPYHIFEYTPDELRAALARRFSHVATLTQHPFAGSLIEVPDDATGSNARAEDLGGLKLDVIDRATVARLQSITPDSEQYTIALASQEALPRVERLYSVAVFGAAVELRSWYDQLDAFAHNERAALARADEAQRRADALETEKASLTEQVRLLGGRLITGEQENASVLTTRAEMVRLDAELTAARSEIARLDAELTSSNTELAASRSEVDVVRREFGVLVESKSWRMTRPARQAFAAARRLRRRNQP